MTNLQAHTLTKPHPPRKLAKTNKAHCNKYKLKIETEEKPSHFLYDKFVLSIFT